LLFELPLQGLPVHVVNLRQTLVSSATETSEDDEGQVSISAKAQISKQVPGFFSQTHNSSDISQPTIDLSQLSQTVKSDIARWIRQTVIVRLSDDDSVTDPEDYEHSKNPRDSPTSIMSFDDFLGLRRVLEDLVDFNILADVLNLVSDQAHGPLLTAVADTVNFYFDIFNAIGAADGLFRKLYKNVEIGQSQEIETDFLESLIDLGSRLPKADQEIRRLRKELSAHAPKFPTAACSPISDTMVEAVQSTEPTFADEMDQILASGNSMDEQTLTRVFGTISRHLEKSFEESSLLTIRFSHLLLTLRGFGPRVFDVLIKDWLDKWLQSSDPSRGLFVSLSPMICSKVVPLKMVLQAIVRTVEIESSQSRKTDLLLDTFEMIMGSRSERMTAVCYRRYRIFDQLQIMMQATPAAVVSIVQKAAELVRATSSATGLRTGRHIRGDAVVGLAQLIIVQQFEAATVADSTPKDLDLDSHTLDALGTILYLCEPTRPAQLGIHDDIVRVFRSINDLNVSLFTLKLKAIFTSAMTAARESTDDLARVFIEQATIIPDDHVSLRACLVSELSASQASSVRNLAEGLVLTWATNDTGSALIETEKRISSLISIVEASAFCVSAAETSPLVERIADILTGILPISQHPDYESRSDTDSEYLFRRLDILLRLLVVHQSTIQHPKYPQQLCYHLLMALSLLLVSPRLGSQTVLLHRTFDILCLLTDSVSDDTRLRCIRSLRDSQCLRDSRLQFIFGYSDTVESEWLQLVTKSAPAAETKPAAPAPATSKPYPLRRWEMMQDATPVATENDTNLSLTLFGSRKSVL